MNCPKCQASIADGSKFCNECGSNISTASKQSGTEPVACDLSLGNLPTMGTGAPGSAVSLGDRRTMSDVPGEAAVAQAAGVPLADRYELMEELGRGGFAVVWKARDRKLGRVVALKRLQVNMLQGHGAAQTLERFRREARAIASLNHRNIVAVYDCDRDSEGDYIVMEYIGGGSLREHLKSNGGRLPVQEATRLARGIAAGLACAHRQNLVHRDIKPANVLLLPDENGELIPKILDFGLARMGGDSDTSVSGYGLGTPYYMPPEQRRDAKNVNHTADIYALGKTLYEMVSGEIPDSVDPDKIPSPPELGQIIFKCVKAKPEERYFSADELVSTLALLVGGGTAASGTAASGTATSNATSENACPACGRANLPDARFCEGCGAGLCAPCPECGRENPLQAKFCPGCGTDRAALQTLLEALERMERFQREGKWSRLIKEAALLPMSVRLPGKKGTAVLAAVQTLQKDATTAQANKAALRAAMASEETAGRWNEALAALAKYAELAPDETEAIAIRRHSYVTKKSAALLASKAAEFPALMGTVRDDLALGRLDAAASGLTCARQILDAVKQDLEGGDAAAAELQELATALAACEAEQAADAAVTRAIRRRQLPLWVAGTACSAAVLTGLVFWIGNALNFRGDIKEFEAAARSNQEERATELVPALRAKYKPAAQWEQWQNERPEMVTARSEAAALGASQMAKPEWRKAEREAEQALDAAVHGRYDEARTLTTSARNGYRMAVAKCEAAAETRRNAETVLRTKVRKILAEAESAKTKGDWGAVKAAAESALALDPPQWQQ